ncbi:MAG: TrmH family RNA methyltransferase [Actinobacteria bacterium]|uniref:TrmH family RNA methyltransferase n=1 Tax=Candidatus Fonsibacter lacus TaxID=2576439 RepID=A0A965LKU7_9PROT|nr:TrmH family RNA methyltransferase [Candidatus Fonsibacter lacus]
MTNEPGAGEFYPFVGVGPHPKPWPVGEKYDQELLANGDQRNVLDEYRYWSVDAIVADLNRKRNPLHIAVENWKHDLNIGSLIRTANAFNVAGIHIVGKRDWNRRGAMVTDRYMTVHHHSTVAEFAEWAKKEKLPIIGIDNIEVSKRLENRPLPKNCVLFFGQEGSGMSEEAVSICEVVLAIEQYGSTRSINASAAGAIAMYAWGLQHLSPKNSDNDIR